MVEKNTFDKLWFNEVMVLLDNNNYSCKANNSVFFAFRKDKTSIRYIIKINRENIEVSIPFNEGQEFTTTFTEYFKVSEFLLYHIKSDLNKYGKPKRLISESMFH